ncbi:hypothetical protein ZOSMA_44G01600 [Zostera marina]|uniref:Uncharacterized protein n=1 Tax=Zostera marina TaxID=29655 RepID=A0A0K9P3F8_ZOSMR|nr:hypothetical protein ZOSMA_44G01600 [Zostera marina]
MHVQKSPDPSSELLNSPKLNHRRHPLPTHLAQYKVSNANSLDFATWATSNTYKIIAFAVLFSTALLFFFLRNAGDSAALLCFESRAIANSPSTARLPYPIVKWENVPRIPPNGPAQSFRAKNWIVVFASKFTSMDDPTVLGLTRINGWQLLVVADSDTPSDWVVKGAIFLSLEDQASLGFRIVDMLPYRSYVRKTVGYLYAIQHGAKKIYDADGGGKIIGGDLGRVFDVDLAGGEDKVVEHQLLHHFSHEDPNRTVVNPYVHFGQRSVWPRGLPLENVGELEVEEFYTQILGGKQFIQQGLSNGLPDVDSVFYFTRKTNKERFDIKFDAEAPKVALPQGMMAPINSFNTLFHTQAFWGLMLPVSVSTMASDVLRGYWAQRILWEIGGYVVVYPPTIHRLDRSESYAFAEEKDLHVHVGRLVNFLVSWRSKKQMLFDKILDLSYVMAEEGFWTDQDVKFTAAWLQDLIGVGYQQPRLMSLEIDLPRATIGHGDKMEFIPQKFPSVHLGVKESGTVNYEIGNLIQWRKKFGNVVLIMYCSGSPDRTALEWRLLYGRIFKTVVIFSEQSSGDLAVEQGNLYDIYKFLPKVFERFPGAEGFLFLEDSMILNYWNLVQADMSKLWITNKISESWNGHRWSNDMENKWLRKQGRLVNKVVSNLPVHFQVSYKENVSEKELIICSGEIFYIPNRFAADYKDLVGLVGQMSIHHKVALPLFFMAMDSPQNFDSNALRSIVYRTNLPPNTTYSSYYSVDSPAVYPCSVRDEVEFIKLVRMMAAGDPLLKELV